MSEINKLRTRLKNTTYEVKEYRMTIIEAKDLLTEIETLLKPAVITPAPSVTDKPVTTIIRVMDGGTL